MIQLKTEEVQFASPENLDSNGRLFFYDGRVFRGIGSRMAPIYAELLRNRRAERLFAAGLVPTSSAPVSLPGYDLVLEHERIPVTSYVTEWSGSMLKDAALLTLDLSLALDEQGLEILDAHPWNVLFDGTHPRFIDFTSIVQVRKAARWRPFDQFVGTFVNPLLLMSCGLAKKARSFLVDWRTLRGRSVTRADVVWVSLQQRRMGALAARLLWKRPRQKAARRETLLRLRRLVAPIEIPLETTRWSDYCGEEVDLATLERWMTKRRVCHEVLLRTKPKSVLDIGSNTGWFSKLAATTGSRVVAFDVDEPSVNKLYHGARAKELNIVPLAMDFRYPTPAYGIGLRCRPAAERFRSEMVLALAIVHHLVFGQKASFESICASLARYASRWLLVEFIPREDVHVAKMYCETFSWYTLDNFLKELRRHFSSVEILPSNPDPRVLLLCEI